MSMSFDRFRVQLECERIVGCTSPDKWGGYKKALEAMCLDSANAASLSAALVDDALDLHYKALVSLCESVNSVSRNLYSWATIKAYYSLFYLLRCSLALNGYAVLRNGRLYLLRIKPGEKPETFVDARSDHDYVISAYRRLYSGSDILQSNSIDYLNPYKWVQERRSQINYRQRQFHDPGPPDFMRAMAEAIESDGVDRLVTRYVDDDPLRYCFLPEHACLALPIRRLLLTHQQLDDNGLSSALSGDQLNLLLGLLTIEGTQLSRAGALVGIPSSARVT